MRLKWVTKWVGKRERVVDDDVLLESIESRLVFTKKKTL